MFDQTAWTLTLDPKAAKIGRGRVLALEGPLRTIIDRRLAARRLDCVLIFHRTSKGRPGQPVKDYRRLWHAAVKAAKLPPGLLPYDLRRSAVRNLIRAGVHETVAMKISGHRTRSTFDRYNIGPVEHVCDAVAKVAAYVEAQPKERNVVGLVRSQNDHNRPASQKTTPAASIPWVAEAGRNRTYRSRDQPGAGRL
jgi:integrase